MSQQLRALTALMVDPGLVPSTLTAHSCYYSISRDLTASAGTCTHMVHVHTHTNKE